MDMNRTHEALMSLAVSAMLTSAFLASAPSGTNLASAGPQSQAIMNALSSLRASDWAGAQEITVPTAVTELQSADPAHAASASKTILTADQQKILLNLRDAHGHDVALSSAVTAALGISKGAEVLTLRQLTINAHPNLHVYIPLPDGGFMLSFVDDVAASSYRLDANFKLLAAVSKKTGEAPIVIPMPDAERNAQTELAYWAAVADNP